MVIAAETWPSPWWQQLNQIEPLLNDRVRPGIGQIERSDDYRLVGGSPYVAIFITATWRFKVFKGACSDLNENAEKDGQVVDAGAAL
jgi:hypothetical protein